VVIDRLRDLIEKRGSEDLALSAYGKLPQYGDFIRHGLSSRGALAFKAWLDRGISRFWEGGSAEYRDHRIGAHSFLLTFPDEGANVYGYLWGSHDAAALRSFPFAIFVAKRAESGPGLTLGRLELLGKVTEQAQRLRPDLKAAADLEEILDALRQTRLPGATRPRAELRQELDRALDAVTLGEFVESLYGLDGETLWPALLGYLERRAEAGDPSLGVRLPSSGQLPLSEQTGFWAIFLESLLARGGRPVQLVCPLDGGGDGIVLLRRELRPEDVCAFHPQMPGYELIEDLREAVPTRAGSEEASPSWTGTMPLGSLLDRGLGSG
jgi:type VI secretion system ImpM family protein